MSSAANFEDIHSRRRRILYVQFSGPAAYPPIEHSSSILAERGWDVTILCIDAFAVPNLELSAHPRVRTVMLSLRRAGGSIGVQYITFTLWCLYWTLNWRPTWIYASDPLVLPAIWVVRALTRTPLVYHEHDSPSDGRWVTRFAHIALRCRMTLARRAELCVLPQHDRLESFLAETGRSLQTICVWNCPRLAELPRKSQDGTNSENKLLVYYHGSINRARLPEEFFVAACRLKDLVQVIIAGYEVPGSIGYVKALMEFVARNGAPGIVQYLGVIPARRDLLESASKAHVGLCLMPRVSDDINLRHMAGASNKAFDCMASGLPLLVSRSEEWLRTFVEPGYGRACTPDSVDSIEAELRWYLGNPDRRREMGRRCVSKIREEWNYDSMFEPVVQILETNVRWKATSCSG
jgi:glycosyltransferase involved in cell wall biosynthesis